MDQRVLLGSFIAAAAAAAAFALCAFGAVGARFNSGKSDHPVGLAFCKNDKNYTIATLILSINLIKIIIIQLKIFKQFKKIIKFCLLLLNKQFLKWFYQIIRI